jgi:glycosyltransferase involved in cell wall biosynthesis
MGERSKANFGAGMKVFDSLKNKKWNGKGIVLNKDIMVMKAKSRISHNIDLKAGEHTLHILGKKRSGNGRVSLHVMTENGTLLLSEDIEFQRSSTAEVRFKFDVPLDYGLGAIHLKRAGNSFGTIELSRIRLVREETEEKAKRAEDILEDKKRNRNPVPAISFDGGLDIKKKIAFVIPYGIYGGAEVYIQSIIQNIDLSGYQMDFLFLGKNKLMNVLQDPRLKMKLCRNLDALKGSLISTDYDYIVYYNRADVYRLLESLKAGTQISSRLIEIYHSDFEWPGALSKVKKRKYVDTMFRVAPSLAKDISGVSTEKKVTIPVGINLDKFSHAHRDKKLRKKLLREKKAVIGTVARMSPEKNIEYILKLATKMPDYSFVLVGDGPLLKSSRKYVEDKGMDNVAFMGFQQDVHKLYPNFDAFLLPSKMEGTPISILEAMSSGTIVFASNVGAISDILEHDKTGFFISGTPAKDRKLIQENLERLDVIGNARRYVEENHDIRTNAREFMIAMIDSEQHFSEMENGDYVVKLKGRFI